MYMASASVRDPWEEMGEEVEGAKWVEMDKIMKRRRRGKWVFFFIISHEKQKWYGMVWLLGTYWTMLIRGVKL